MAESLTEQLKALANTWALKARDHARESKARSANGDLPTSSYHRGMAETYHKLAMELAEIVKTAPDARATGTQPVSAGTSTAQSPAAPAQPDEEYASVSLGEVMSMLEFGGITARDVNRHKDNAFTAIFSRWQPVSDIERLDKIRKLDPRIVVLANGRLPDTGDPYVDFAFKER